MFSDKRKTRTLSVVLSAAAIVLVWVGLAASALAQGRADTTPPAAVDDVRVLASSHNSITIGWTATGDNRKVGTAFEYEILYWTPQNGFVVACPPTPRATRSLESVTVGGLSSNTTYYLALKVADEAGNWSGLSNVESATTKESPNPPPLWDVQIVDAIDESHFGYPSLDFDPVSGNPGIAYAQSHVRLKFAQWNAADSCWKIEDVLEGSTAAIDFAYNPDGVPTMSYVSGDLYFAEMEDVD